MSTINIAGYTITVSESLSDALWQFKAYMDLPTQTKFRIDPKCSRGQDVYDDARNALDDAFDELDVGPRGWDDNHLDWIESAVEQHCV